MGIGGGEFLYAMVAALLLQRIEGIFISRR